MPSDRRGFRPARHPYPRSRASLLVRAACFLLALALLPACSLAQDGGTTLYVAPDGDDGNHGRAPDRPLRTLRRAGRLARPGDLVLVAPGTYEGGFVTRASGEPDARIVYRSEEPLQAWIDGAGHRTAWRNLGDHVDIVGFDVSGSEYHGIFNEGAHVRIVGNKVHHLTVPDCNEPIGGAGIQHGDYQAEGNETLGNVVYEIVPPGPFCNLIHGIYHANRGGRVQNNIVYNVSANGIQTWHAATAVAITNNLVWGANIGINVAANEVTARDFLVANNILLNNNYGIVENGRLGPGNRYLNNLLHDNATDFRWRGDGEREGTIFADPRLVDFRPDGSGDYRPGEGSPAIDAGTGEGAPERDIDGRERPQGGAVDLGPYECPCG